VPDNDVETLLSFLRYFADDHHQGKEETALFPELMKTAAAQTEPVRHLVFEHDQERSLVTALEDSMRTKSGKEFVYYANRLCGILRTHIYKEEHVLFEAIENAISAEQDRSVTAEFRDIDRREQDRKRKALRDLRRLEWTYLRRSGQNVQEEDAPRDAISRAIR
jgi:hemerythrin-like domain-containing protein